MRKSWVGVTTVPTRSKRRVLLLMWRTPGDHLDHLQHVGGAGSGVFGLGLCTDATVLSVHTQALSMLLRVVPHGPLVRMPKLSIGPLMHVLMVVKWSRV